MSFRALKIFLADIQESGVDLEATLIAASSPTVRPLRNLNLSQHNHVPGSNNDGEWEAYIPQSWEMAQPTPTNAPQNMFRSVHPQKFTTPESLFPSTPYQNEFPSVQPQLNTPPESPFTSTHYQTEFRSVQPQLNTPPESPYSGASSLRGWLSVQSQLHTSPSTLPQILRKAVPQPIPEHPSFSYTATQENHDIVSPSRRGTNPFLPNYVYQPPKLPFGSGESTAISNTSRVKDCVICTDEKALGLFPLQTPTSTCNHDPNTCLDCLQKYIQTQAGDGMINEQSIKCPECSNPLDLAEIQKYADPDTFQL
jgi:hypothetical protein